MMNDKIILYPASWLYNAGVIGLALVKSEYFSFNDGLVELSRDIFSNLDLESDYFDASKIVNLKGKNDLYPNFIDTKGNQIDVFCSFIKAFENLSEKGNCHICYKPYYLNDRIISELKNQYGKDAENFLTKIKSFDMVFNRLLGPTSSKFPNGFWNFNQGLDVCHLCSFILIHHHLALTKLADGSQIFINAPSFKLMYELNRLVKAMFEASTLEEQRTKREILAISIIEYAAKIPVMLGYWTSMNIEVVIKTRDNIDFFSLPFEVVKIISNRNIAALLSEIGETKILNLILDQKYSVLVELSYKILRVALKKDDRKSKQDKSALNDFIKLDKNRKNLIEFSNKLLKLYSLIEEKLEGVEI